VSVPRHSHATAIKQCGIDDVAGSESWRIRNILWRSVPSCITLLRLNALQQQHQQQQQQPQQLPAYLNDVTDISNNEAEVATHVDDGIIVVIDDDEDDDVVV